MEKIENKKRSRGNDLPGEGTDVVPASANGLLNALAGPVDMIELKSALLKFGKVKHVGGALPPLFPEKGVREGDARLVRYLGHEVVPSERAGQGGGAFCVLNFDVLDHTKATTPVTHRAQMILNATLETYFGAKSLESLDDKKLAEKILKLVDDDEDFKIPTRDAEETPILIITYAGQMVSKKKDFAGAKRWIIEEFTPAKN